MREFYRMLKPGASVHIILPDIELQMNKYMESKNDESIDDFLAEMLQYGKRGQSLTHRILDVIGAYGLEHLWMYDNRSIRKKLQNMGFQIVENLETPSSTFRQGDDSIHVFGVK